MVEYIKREEAIDACFNGWNNNAHDCAANIRNIPAADVVERKTGVWIGEGDGYADGNMVYNMWYCSSCGSRFDEWEEKPDWKYCPVCGSYNGGDDDA